MWNADCWRSSRDGNGAIYLAELYGAGNSCALMNQSGRPYGPVGRAWQSSQAMAIDRRWQSLNDTTASLTSTISLQPVRDLTPRLDQNCRDIHSQPMSVLNPRSFYFVPVYIRQKWTSGTNVSTLTDANGFLFWSHFVWPSTLRFHAAIN